MAHGQIGKQDRGGQQCVLKQLSHFSFFFIFVVTSSSSSLLPRRHSFLVVALFSLSLFPCCTPPSLSLLARCHSFLAITPSSLSLLPPRPSFFLVAPSSLLLLLPRRSFLLVAPCSFLHRSFLPESVNLVISSNLMKASPTNGRTYRPTNRRTDKASYRDARTHLKKCAQNTEATMWTYKLQQ